MGGGGRKNDGCGKGKGQGATRSASAEVSRELRERLRLYFSDWQQGCAGMCTWHRLGGFNIKLQ